MQGAAVLIQDGKVEFKESDPPADVMETFCKRKDNQIMALELLAVAVGLFTIRHKLRGKRARVWCDNRGGEGALLRRWAASDDHNLLSHGIWLTAVRHQIGLYLCRVEKHSNIGYDPSREEYVLLNALGASRVPLKIPNEVWEPWRWAE